MGRSPESPFSFAPCPTPVEQAYEAMEEEKAVPIPQNRRKSSTWKAFNLKRQLSKVDIKIKNPLKEKRNSIFYSDASPGQELNDNAEDVEKSSPESDENTVIDNQSVIDLSVVSPKTADEDQFKKPEDFEPVQFSPEEEPEIPFLVGSLGTQYEYPSCRRVGFAARPDNLDLVDEDGVPVRPPRAKKKQEKRDQRLLSVPNIKFQKPELQSYRDLREKEDTVVSPQPSFTGNLMRRFSKF